MIMDPIHVLFIIILFIITLLTISSENLKLMGRSMISNDIKMDIEEIKSAMENFFSLKKLLIFFAITIQFLGTVYCLGLLGLNPALDIVHGIDFVFPLAKASFFISIISVYLIVLHTLEGKLNQNAYILTKEIIPTDKYFTIKYYFPLIFLASLTFGMVALVILILF